MRNPERLMTIGACCDASPAPGRGRAPVPAAPQTATNARERTLPPPALCAPAARGRRIPQPRWAPRAPIEEIPMKICDAMTRDVCVASPNETISDAARQMAAIDAGVLPVGENDRLVGMITDRDIAVRAVAQGLGPDTPIREVMSQEVLYCFEDDSVDDVARNMADQQVRRLPVVDRDKRLVGIVSIGDVARCEPGRQTAEAMAGIAQQGGARSQSLH